MIKLFSVKVRCTSLCGLTPVPGTCSTTSLVSLAGPALKFTMRRLRRCMLLLVCMPSALPLWLLARRTGLHQGSMSCTRK